jgi:hypothetical protein
MTQCERILEYIKRHGSITTRDAVIDLGIASLSRRICDMQSRGIKIIKVQVCGENRYGEMTHYTRYIIGGTDAV